MVASGAREELREAERVCEKAGEAVHTIVIKVLRLARDGIEARHKIKQSFERNKDVQLDLDEHHAADCSMRGKHEAAKGRMTPLKW